MAIRPVTALDDTVRRIALQRRIERKRATLHLLRLMRAKTALRALQIVLARPWMSRRVACHMRREIAELTDEIAALTC